MIFLIENSSKWGDLRQGIWISNRREIREPKARSTESPGNWTPKTWLLNTHVANFGTGFRADCREKKRKCKKSNQKGNQYHFNVLSGLASLSYLTKVPQSLPDVVRVRRCLEKTYHNQNREGCLLFSKDAEVSCHSQVTLEYGAPDKQIQTNSSSFSYRAQ